MRFSLQDVKKQVQRRGDALFVRLHFLRPGELHREIDQLIAYHEQHTLKREARRLFSLDDARACIGDYRLAHCLIATISAWYHWDALHWYDIVQNIGGAVLEEAGITSPVYLRLALFNFVNEHYHGFLGTQQRTAALQMFATHYQLSVSDLEYLLVLDSDEEEILLRETPQLPTAQEVATRYNQWVFEAALFNASNVHFVIDCNAFERAQQTAQTSSTGTGVGAVIKRLCYLARLLGVYYDLAYDEAAPHTAPRLQLTLYGPQEMTGAPQQYGLRLARLCRLLLGYGLPLRQQAAQGKQRSATNHINLLSSAIVQAAATVHFLQRTYTFTIDATVLSLLPPVIGSTHVPTVADDQQAVSVAEPSVERIAPQASSIFDSSIEQAFAEAFTALQNSQAVDGWQLIREPEPLLLDHGIFIPDFALTRHQQRIYVEILGFWTPSYRERKIQKLQQLQERNDIVLAIPVEARDAFVPRSGQSSSSSTGLPPQFPVVWYEGQLSATELLHLLRVRYDNFAERLALIDVAQVRQRVEGEGLIAEHACYDVLHCYRRSELPLAAERVTNEGIVFTAGIGLYHTPWLEQLRTSFVEGIDNAGIVSLTEILRQSRERWLALQPCADATIEAILGLWPEIRVYRSSIFEATVEVIHIHPSTEDGAVTAQPANTVDDDRGQLPTPTKKATRGKGPKKRVVRETSQGDLWGS